MKSKLPLLPVLDYLPQLLIEIVGSAVTSADYEVLNHHLDYWVIAVPLETPSGSLIVKLAGRQSTMDVTFERTALIHSLVGTQTAIPTAEILAVDDSYNRFPWRYLIQRRIQGQPWAEVAPLLIARKNSTPIVN